MRNKLLGDVRRFFLALLVLLSAGRVYAADPIKQGYTTYLLPINVPEVVSGARGTSWKTELWIHNPNSFPIVVRDPCERGRVPPPCQAIVHPPGVTEQATPRETSSYRGPLLLHLWSPPGAPADVTFSSRLFELSRGAQPAGVHIPVVREDEFFTGVSRFIGIPGGPAFRVALRAYDPRNFGGYAVHVEVVRFDGTPIGRTNLTMGLGGRTDESGYGAIYDMAAIFPELLTVDRYDIRVTPLSPMQYWALVSVTDNETQNVLLVTAD